MSDYERLVTALNRCRRLLSGVTDEETRSRLRDYIRELERQLEEEEGKRPPPS